MQRNLIFCAILLISLSLSAQTIDDPRNLNGVWLYKVGLSTTIKTDEQKYSYREFTKQFPFIKGVLNPIPWRTLEPQQGKFDWESFDQNVNAMADAGLNILLMIWVGPHSPDWIYTKAGVPKFFTTASKAGDEFSGYPDYTNAEYRKLWYEMLDAVADRIAKLPKATRNRVVIFQSAEGTTGDETPFKGTPSEERFKNIGTKSEWWINYRRDAWKHLYDLYKSKKDLNVHVLINGDETPEELAWSNKNTPNIWRKANPMGHIYQANTDAEMKQVFDPLINFTKGGTNATQIRCRDEFDVHLSPSYDISPAWYSYWVALHALHFGVDMWSVHPNKELFDKADLPAFEFFSRYGGYKDPATSPGAFCALRDGLDAADFKRFPEKEFGPGTSTDANGTLRTVKIAKAFESKGARQEDPEKAQGGPVNNFRAKALNDVNWNILPGNYERYLTQYKPNETSIGYWRVGNPDQPEGRFARGFDHSTGKDTMYFDVNDRLFKNFPNNGRQKVAITISYFDNEGEWQLIYDAVGQKNKIAVAHKNSNSGKWKTITITLSDACFGNHLDHSTDLALVNKRTDSKDAIFHMVEIIKK